MHELSLVRSVIEIAEAHASAHRARRVHSLKLSFGRLSCIEPKALEFAFAVQSKGTAVEGASLEFEISPIVIYCFSCGRDIECSSFDAVCPDCAGQDVMLVGGTEELRLLELDVD